ncbi:MAG: Ig-like domain-containing protein, partial [Planctomycetaceae bacterium]|nr:Ig-like domain-containing protein [Planctomycetaceae bacterium]
MPAIRSLAVSTVCQFVLLCCTALATADDTLQVSPERVVLNSSRDRMQLLVSSKGNDVTQQASYQSSHPDIASVDARGSITSQAAGEAKITVTVGDASVEVPLTVNADSGTRQVNFRTDIQPVLSRHGCNSGGCHGKASGQNGFKLSLFGFDTEFDYGALVHEARGRRIDLAAPERSLLLTKSIGSVPHGGGKRIETGSDAYAMMLAWIQNGAPRPTEETPRVVSIQIEPSERILQSGSLQQLRVTANYSDGTTRDVTRNTDYGSNVDVVATVDEQGGV